MNTGKKIKPGRQGGMDWEIKVNIGTLCMKQMAGEGLLQSTGKKEGTICLQDVYIKLTLKSAFQYTLCRQMLFGSAYTRYLDESNSQSQKVHWQMPGAWEVARENGELEFNVDRVLVQESKKFREMGDGESCTAM